MNPQIEEINLPYLITVSTSRGQYRLVPLRFSFHCFVHSSSPVRHIRDSLLEECLFPMLRRSMRHSERLPVQTISKWGSFDCTNHLHSSTNWSNEQCKSVWSVNSITTHTASTSPGETHWSKTPTGAPDTCAKSTDNPWRKSKTNPKTSHSLPSSCSISS